MARHQLGVLVVVGVGVGAVLAAPRGEARGQPFFFVDANATGPTHNGFSWCNAYLDLTTALNAASVGTTIYVADGTYRPDPSGLANPRKATFQLRNGVPLYGGYAGCGAPNPNARNTNPSGTILTGDLLGNDPAGNEFRDCCNASYLPGCPDAGCAAAVCAQYSFCCDIQWEEVCAQTAQGKCDTLCHTKDDNTYHVVTGSGTDATAVLDGVTITAGQADDPTVPDGQGAGMYVQGGSPTIRNCLFRRNDARGRGGGLYVGTGSPQVIGCTFDDNRARNYLDAGGGSGGGAYVEVGNPFFSGCTFTANAVDLAGAGIYGSQITGTIESCRFAGNSGTAIDCYGSSPLIERCTIVGNGGGVVSVFGGPASVRDCLILGNFGAGVYFDGSAGEIVNAVIAGNFSGGSGGGVNCSSSNATILNCTIVGNTAYTNAGGVYVGGRSTTRMENSILRGNLRRSDPSQIYLQPFSPSSIPTLTVSHSDVQDGQSGVGGSGTLIWGKGNIDQDPLFVDADGADGIVGNEDDNLRLRAESPCVDAGDNGAVPPSVTVDLDGHPRIVDGDGYKPAVVDMGAYEAPKPIPALGGWGVGVMTLLIFIVGTVLIRSRGRKAFQA